MVEQSGNKPEESQQQE
jgi:DnaJ homolog subfamily C member 8